MNFITQEFVLFFLPVLLVGWMLRRLVGWYRAFLIIANLVFYACAGLSWVPLLLGVVVLNWGTVRLMEWCRNWGGIRRLTIALNILAHIAILGFFKYYEFLVVTATDILSRMNWPTEWLFHEKLADLVFPIGLSFFTFQGLAYSIDRFRNPDIPARSFWGVLSFISFFPSIMAGPILREKDFFPYLEAPVCSSRDFQEGFALILSGLFKKVVLATYLSEHIVSQVFDMPTTCSSWTVIVGVYAYSIQIFCDFSGYSDLAVGIGRLMGFRLPENFANPYLACSLKDFWRRWHISLSSWLRDYLYIPLGGSRRGSRAFNLLVTMLIGGLWHGSHTRFLIWGGLHGLGLAINHAFTRWLRDYVPRGSVPVLVGALMKLVAWLVTFHFVSLLWIFFRAEDMERCREIFSRIVFWGTAGEGFPVLSLYAIGVGLGLQILGKNIFHGFVEFQMRLPWPVRSIVLAALAGLILNMGPEGVLPFIYFQF